MVDKKIVSLDKKEDKLEQDIENWFENIPEEKVSLQSITIEEDYDDHDESKVKEKKELVKGSSEFEDMLIRKIINKQFQELEEVMKKTNNEIKDIEDLLGLEDSLNKEFNQALRIYNSIIFSTETLSVDSIEDSKIRHYIKIRMNEIIDGMIELF